jgi:hypothetical protein
VICPWGRRWEGGRNYSGKEDERMVKLQDVILKAIAKNTFGWTLREG